MFLTSVSFGTQLFKCGLGSGAGERRGRGGGGWDQESSELLNWLSRKKRKSPDVYANFCGINTLTVADFDQLIRHR